MLKFYSRYIILFILSLTVHIKSANAYAVLAHEAIIDASWEKGIKPLLRDKYPNSTDTMLKVAHSYAYGGAMAADMGYMPMGSSVFSDLMHYSRSGDMVIALLKDAQNLNEYAFALGALSHYLADEYGHSKATNLTVPLVYKKLRKKYGDFITYGDDNLSHSRVEFSFDVLQIARGNYNTQAYHNFIGFNMSKPVLERAFLETYGLKLDDLFGNFDSAVATMRWGVNKLFPTLIRKTWKSQRDSIMKRQPSITAKKFRYKMDKREYYQEFGKGREKPGFLAGIATFVIKIMPKIGPFKTFKYVDPGQKGEKNFITSFDTILARYAGDLNQLYDHSISLADIDFDTGRETRIGEYALADQTYADLLIALQDDKFRYLTPALKEHLLQFYKNESNISRSKRYPIKLEKVTKALHELKQAIPVKQSELIGIASKQQAKF